MAEALEQNTVGEDERQLVTFHLGPEEFGTDIMNVREIVRLGEVTKIPQAPFYVEGVTNLRGTILPIIDGRKRFGMESRVSDESTRVLVIDVRGTLTGVIVDRVAEVLSVSSADIEPSPKVLRSSMDADFISGIVKLDQGRRIIMTLNIGAVLSVEVPSGDETVAAAVATSSTEKSEQTDKLDEDQLVTFSLAGEEYAIDIMRVKEIIRVPGITKVPNARHYFEGVVSIRNQLLPIVNMRTFFGLPDMEINDQARVIIVDTGAITAGFRVDRVAEVIRVPLNLIEPPPLMFAGQEGARVRGVAKLDSGKRLLMCLNAENLLPVDAFAGMAEGTGKSEALAATDGREGSVIDEEQLVTFLLGKEEFAVQIDQVQEINRMTDVTHMPGAPSYVDGLVNLRGNIIPAFNLRRRFGLPDKERDDATRIIIVDFDNRKTGIIVDSVSEVLRFDRSLVEAAPEMVTCGIDGDYISGVGKLQEGKRMVLILDLAKVVRIESTAPVETTTARPNKRKK